MPAELRGSIGRFQLFAYGFGAIVGSAWAVILNLWLSDGPGGAMIGFAAGAVVMAGVGACYAELTARVPVTGGDYVFAKHVFGRSVGFLVGWFVALAFIAVIIFEGLAIAWMAQLLFPAAADITLYHSLDTPVTRNQIVIGSVGALMLTFVHASGSNVAARVQAALTYGFLAFIIVLLAVLSVNGKIDNLSPILPSSGSTQWWQGALYVFALCAFLLSGFQAVCQAVEERSAALSLKTVARILILSIAAAALFYIFVVVAASLSVPWKELRTEEFAILRVAKTLPFGSLVATALLILVIMSLIKTWNSIFLTATRTFVAMARDGFLPQSLARIDDRSGTAKRAVLVVGILNVFGLFLGRGAIGSLLEMTALALVCSALVCCVALIALRRRSRESNQVEPAFQVPGGDVGVYLATGGAVVMAGAALTAPIWQNGTPFVTYSLFGSWSLLGLILLAIVSNTGTGTTDGSNAAAPADMGPVV